MLRRLYDRTLPLAARSSASYAPGTACLAEGSMPAALPGRFGPDVRVVLDRHVTAAAALRGAALVGGDVAFRSLF